MNRRTFIKSTAAATLGGMSLLGAACGGESQQASQAQDADQELAERSLTRIGLQLYTIRSVLEKDFVQGIEQVAAAGYDEVEFAGYYNNSPADVRALLDRVGLTAPSTHIPLDQLHNNLAGVIEAAHTIGHQYVVCPWLDESQRSLEAFKGHAAFFNDVGKTLKEAGIQFAYHNHDFEFKASDGQLPYDLLLAETDPDLVKMEIDLYWITYAGQDPLAYFGRYPGRFPLCHVKDMAADKQIVNVGDGNIDFSVIFAQSEQAGFQHYFVENDHPEDPIASITASYNYLKQLRY